MARVRFRARFFVLLFALIAVIAGVVLFLVFGGGEGELANSTMQLKHVTRSVIIRDEVSKTTERYDKIIFDVAEGAHVQNDDQIAQVFKWGYQEETMQSLLEVQTQIQEKQLAQFEGIVKQDLININLEIQQKQLEIRAAAGGKGDVDMLTLEQELKALLISRMDMLRDVQANEELSALYTQEETQLNSLAAWKRDIVNDAGSGVVSFYFDGYEQVLSADKLDMLTSDLLTRVLRGTGTEAPAGSAATESPLYRLIDDEHFYIAFLTSSSEPLRVAAGEEYTVVFDGYANTPFRAVALAPMLSGTQVVNILEFSQPMGDLMGVRVVEATILKDVTGIEVPKSAIRMRDGIPGVMRVVGTDSVWIEVEVLAANENDAIVRAKNQDETLTPGARYKKS